MAYRGHIPYNPATDPKALLAQGLQNYAGGLNQQTESKNFGQAVGGIDPEATFFQALSHLLSANVQPQRALETVGARQRSQHYQRQGRSKYSQFRDEFTEAGFDPKIASQYAQDALLISTGKKPRASSVKALEQKSLPEQLTFWQTVYNKTLDPQWGGTQPTEDMDAAREMAKQNLDRITGAMRQSTQPGADDGDMQADLKGAMSAIQRGAPIEQVYNRLVETYPDREQEIKSALGQLQ